MRLTVRLCAFAVTIVASFSASHQVLAQVPVTAGQVIISELRFRGPNGTRDEFVELYNNTNSPIVVQASDSSAGWAVATSNGTITGPICFIPNGTIIPARGHFLCANQDLDFGSGYSLSAYPSGNPGCGQSIPNANAFVAPSPFAQTTPDAGFIIADLPDGSGIALFTSTNGPNWVLARRLDAFGFTGSPALYKEGTGFATIPSTSNEHTLYRYEGVAGVPRDNNINATDFIFVATTSGVQPTLNGAPGPENRCSPIVNNTTIATTLLDPNVSGAAPPNRERTFTPEPNAPLGSLFIRRTITNNTGLPVTRLRFRLIDLTTRGTPKSMCPGFFCSDLRVLTSSDATVTLSNQTQVLVRGLRLEAEPPFTPEGGGYNSSVSADFITLGTPLFPGQSVNVHFKLGIVEPGNLRFIVNIEALNGPVVLP
jgi:hypothetical protein